MTRKYWVRRAREIAQYTHEKLVTGIEGQNAHCCSPRYPASDSFVLSFEARTMSSFVLSVGELDCLQSQVQMLDDVTQVWIVSMTYRLELSRSTKRQSDERAGRLS